MSQRSNQFGQKGQTRQQEANRLAGLSTPPPTPNSLSLIGTRHPRLATKHSNQARNMTISQLWVNYQCWIFTKASWWAQNVASRYQQPLWYSNLGWLHSQSREPALLPIGPKGQSRQREASRPAELSELNKPLMVKVVGCGLFCTKSLTEVMLTYWPADH